jgi:serine/threonine protein kinase
VIKVYQQIDDVSQERLAREKEALELFNKSSAPVPVLLEFDLAKSYLLLSPYATTLKELDKFNSQTLCAIAGAAASFFRIAKNLDFVHKDISPDNILVCPGNKILINDLGSCHRTEALYDTNGATLLYCCPLFGAHFENNTGGPYSYTLSNDIRALFICLFEFSLPERMVGNVVLSKVLPWERVRQTMQSSKWSFFMSCNWKKTVLPEAVPFLEGLWKEIFVQASWDSGKGTFVINIESVLSLLEALGKQTVISAVK